MQALATSLPRAGLHAPAAPVTGKLARITPIRWQEEGMCSHERQHDTARADRPRRCLNEPLLADSLSHRGQVRRDATLWSTLAQTSRHLMAHARRRRAGGQHAPQGYRAAACFVV